MRGNLQLSLNGLAWRSCHLGRAGCAAVASDRSNGSSLAVDGKLLDPEQHLTVGSSGVGQPKYPVDTPGK